VRSTATNWSKNSVIAVDAGSHLASITRILEQHFPLVSDPESDRAARDSKNGNGDRGHLVSSPSGPAHVSLSDDDSDVDTPFSEREAPITLTTLKEGAFAGLPFPHASARANALHVMREHISTYLITHPHLDHVSGFVINTAAFHNTSRPKRLAALPFTVNAIKTHIFNNVIWPNLTDEEGGVGLVTFQRLAEGGNIALGEGSGRGFIEVCDGLGVKGFKVSHGHCMRVPGLHRGSNANLPDTPGLQHLAAAHHQVPLADGHEGRSFSFSYPTQSAPGTPVPGGYPPDQGRRPSGGLPPVNSDHCVVDSTAYFIHSEPTPTTPKREILIFGDVEPDTLSLSPRTALIWAEAAPKIALGILTGIFIEVSYTNARGDAVLFGHLAPRHLLAELQSLADMVKESRKGHEREREEARQNRKRKRASKADGLQLDGTLGERRSKSMHLIKGIDSPLTGTSTYADDEFMTDYSRDATGTHTPNPNMSSHQHLNPPASTPSARNLTTVSAEHSRALLAAAFDSPLKGVKVVIIHVKDTFADGPLVGDQILKELKEGEKELHEQGRGLGCVFEISKSGGSYWF
jgi:cAMP phosphodiesterase